MSAITHPITPEYRYIHSDAGAPKERLNALLEERHRTFPQKDAQTGQALEQHFGEYQTWLESAYSQSFDPEDRLAEQARTLAQHPIFICGHAKSGTSLLVNLLDDHPALVTMPGDSHAVTMARQYGATDSAAERDAWRAYWLARFINPTGQKPFWLLGKEDEAYARFLNYLSYWRSKYEGEEAAAFMAVVLAYFCANGRRPDTPTAWVSKTPANEYRVDALLRQYPAARFLHVMRNPFANLASMKRLSTYRSGRAYTLRSAYRIRRSMAKGRRNQQRLGDKRYAFVHYEDLVEEPESTLRTVCRWLDIPFHETLFEPTVNGLPATANSMKRSGAHRGEVRNNNKGWTEELSFLEQSAAHLLYWGWERIA